MSIFNTLRFSHLLYSTCVCNDLSLDFSEKIKTTKSKNFGIVGILTNLDDFYVYKVAPKVKTVLQSFNDRTC